LTQTQPIRVRVKCVAYRLLLRYVQSVLHYAEKKGKPAKRANKRSQLGKEWTVIAAYAQTDMGLKGRNAESCETKYGNLHRALSVGDIPHCLTRCFAHSMSFCDHHNTGRLERHQTAIV
jgi:hypothetical protein